MKDHSLLVERYRPVTLENYVGNEHIKKSIQQYLDQNDTISTRGPIVSYTIDYYCSFSIPMHFHITG